MRSPARPPISPNRSEMDFERSLSMVPVGPRWLAVAAVALSILVVSVIRIPESVPEGGGGIPTSVLFHFVGYGVLAVTLSVAIVMHRRSSTATGGAFLGASGYGALMESVQLSLPYRSFSYVDMLTNAAGAATGLVALAVVYWWLQ